MNRLLLLSLLWGAAWLQTPSIPVQGTQGEGAQHLTLRTRDLHRIGVPIFSFRPQVACDARGEVFFDISQFYSVKSILRVRNDGTQPTPLPFPAGLDAKGQWHFSIDSSGAVYLLLTNVDNPLLIHLSPSGEEVSRTDLSLPKFFDVHSFALQPDGRSLFFGSLEKVSEDSSSGSSVHSSSASTDVPFLIWLDPTGKFARKEQFGKEFSVSTTLLDGQVAAGRPGIFYVAKSTEIREYGARGDLLLTFPIVPPSKDSHVANFQFVDGRIALLFRYPSVEGGIAKQADGSSTPYFGPLDETWLLAGTVSGEVEGYYNEPKDITGSALCYLGEHSFLYYTVKDRLPFLVEADQ
jgi:hypothetical protein